MAQPCAIIEIHGVNAAWKFVLRADPGLLPTAIEELLRYDTPLPLFERWVQWSQLPGGCFFT